jgi:outer membrane lipoprotein-sorting protein
VPADTFAKYIQALGGAERLAAVTSYVATGTYAGFDTLEREVPAEILGQAPDRRAIVARGPAGDLLWTYDGSRGWRYQPDTPVPLIDLTAWNLDGARLDAMVYFPAGLQRAFGQWQASFADIDGRQVAVLRGTSDGHSPVNLYFDESGLLVRLTRWTGTGAGPVPVQIDYSDYREVAGVKMPFRWVMTWTNGQSTVQLKEIRPNVPIDARRFARPIVN